MAKLFVLLFGYGGSGKSYTWNALYDYVHRSGRRSVTSTVNLKKLELPGIVVDDTFLVSGSPEERGVWVGDIIVGNPTIVFCSMQYHEECWGTVQYAINHRYDIRSFWLNPSRGGGEAYFDWLGLSSRLLAHGSTLAMIDGNQDQRKRAEPIIEAVYGWCQSNGIGRVP